ncbi:MAG: hypothetical protein EP330_14610 [Deltaproteobacteria bacterium]|nr:MAG: hypothetical protein EP330_14610 [Deltaproteobacteria bacterium]
MRWLPLLALLACGTSEFEPCDPEAQGCASTEACIWTAAETYVCAETCFDTGTCSEGSCTGAGSSCPACRDYIPYCE